jgi:4-carboxymuconolactone decarboxylase
LKTNVPRHEGYVLIKCSAYCGMPAGMEAFRVADRVLSKMKKKGEMERL